MSLFEDIFRVDDLNPEGKKFDKVDRVVAKSERSEMYMQLDVNNDIYPIKVGEKFSIALATTLSTDGTPDTGYYTPGMRHSLADNYEYVMHGKLYKVSEEGSHPNIRAEIYVSFSGLLMLMKGDPTTFNQFQLDQRLFLLMRKV
ncbi:unnamed protein product [Rhodiola kirilowii]